MHRFVFIYLYYYFDKRELFIVFLFSKTRGSNKDSFSPEKRTVKQTLSKNDRVPEDIHVPH